MNKLLDALNDKSDRSAQFKTVIALNIKGEQHLFTGIVKGAITLDKTGNHGFGYDPIFQPENYRETFAELSSDIKNKISHRAKATQQLIDFLNSTK